MRWLTLALVLAVGGCGTKGSPPLSSPEWVSLDAGGEGIRAYLCRPPGSGPFPAVIVVHGDRGLTEQDKKLTQKLSEFGFVALAVDLYRGEVVQEVVDAHIMERGVPSDRALGDIQAALSYLERRQDVNGSAVGIIGWDMGGGLALDAATRDRRIKAVVNCYGRLITDPELLMSLQAPVLGVFAGRDEGISTQTIDQFRNAMHKAGKRVAGLHVYPDVEHGFMMSDTAADVKTVSAAWQQIAAFFRDELVRD